MDQSILTLKNVTKVYSNGVVANKNINFDLKAGEIHAIVGENGAGKSTLMKLLFGMEHPNEGQIFFKGKEVTIETPQMAIDMGIGMVHQHFMLVPSFTVSQNMLLGMEPKKGFKIDLAKVRKMTLEMSEKYQLKVDPDMVASSLTVGMKQKLEILKALIRGAKILILDEPTAVLTPQETEELFEQLIHLKNSGHTIIFISHKLKEVKRISDRITVIRKGQTQGVFNTADVDEQEISRRMVGRDVFLNYDKEPAQKGETIVKLDDISIRQKQGKYLLKHIDLSMHTGKILGVAGVEGNGQTELVELLTGKRYPTKGEVRYKGQSLVGLNMREMREIGISYIPEDRMTQGVADDTSIWENILANRMKDKSFVKKGWIQRKQILKTSEALKTDYDIVCSDINQKVGMLSGGNIQKVVVARECSVMPSFLIAEQPTRGVDIGAARLIHEKLIELRDQMTAVLLISADLNEILELSDELVVMYEGEIVAYFDSPKTLTENELGLYMLGLKRQEAYIHKTENDGRKVNA